PPECMDFVPLNKVKGEGTRRRSRRVGGSAEPVDPLLAREASLVGTTAPYLPPPLRYGGRDLPPSPPALGDKATAAGTFPLRLRLWGTKLLKPHFYPTHSRSWRETEFPRRQPERASSANEWEMRRRSCGPHSGANSWVVASVVSTRSHASSSTSSVCLTST